MVPVKMGSSGDTETALVQVQAHNNPIFRVTDLSDNAKLEFTLGNGGDPVVMRTVGAEPLYIKTHDTLRWIFGATSGTDLGDVSLKQDSKKLYFGAGGTTGKANGDASISYDGSNFLINTEEVEVAAGKGNLGINTTTLDSQATGCIAISNGAEPNAHTDNQIYIGSKDSVGQTTNGATLQICTEADVDATALDAVGTLSHRISIWLNKVEYYLYLDPV